MATSMSGRRSALMDAMTAGYKPFLSHPLRTDGPHGLCVRCFSPPSRIRPSLHWDRVLRPPRDMATALDLPAHDSERIPVVLLGGVNLVRALGLAGVPTIVVSHEDDEPAFASRYCAAKSLLPSLANTEGVADALVTIGDRLATRYGRRVPLFYGSDDYLKLIYAHRERLERYFLLLLNDPAVADAMLTKDSFQAFARERGLPVPAALSWDDHGSASVADHAGPVVVKPSNKDGWSDSLLRKRAFGRAKAIVFPNGAMA